MYPGTNIDKNLSKLQPLGGSYLGGLKDLISASRILQKQVLLKTGSSMRNSYCKNFGANAVLHVLDTYSYPNPIPMDGITR